MSTYGKYAKNIKKNKLPYENWNQFYTSYIKSANILAGTQFVLNYVTMDGVEELWQDETADDIGSHLTKLLFDLVEFDFNMAAESVFTIMDIRDRLKNCMDCLVTYTDHFMLYQYVMNCMKYRFEDYDYEDYDDEEFAKELINYITSDKDQSVVRYKTMEVIKSLPIRMTRSRFFEMVKDGFSVYKGGDSDTLDSFNYMIRGAALLYEPENMEKNFPDLYDYDAHFRELDYESLDSEEYYKEIISLQECIDYLNTEISSFQLLTEAINQLYAFYLTNDSADTSSPAYKTCRQILSDMFSGEFKGVEDESFVELLKKLEGVQEGELDDLDDAEGCLEDIMHSEFAESAPKKILGEIDTVDMLSKLLSTSYFADLDEDEEIYELSDADISASFGAFRLELEPVLKKVPKLMSRALMAAVMGYLPMNFHDTDELYEYIYNSLKACTSLPEKMALVEHLEEIMDDADDWE